MRKEKDILFDVLMDFLKELPEWFDREETTYKEAAELIDKFMERHELHD